MQDKKEKQAQPLKKSLWKNKTMRAKTSVWIREEESPKSRRLKVLDKGKEIEVLGEGEEYFKVELGFIKKEYLE